MSTSIAPGSQKQSFAALRALAFITGCGRSGTTILGRLLAKHPEITYLNDRFDLWVGPLPVTDIWGKREQLGGKASKEARVALDAADVRALPAGARERFLAKLEQMRAGRPVLVEKLAINNFRIGFLMELCPEARLINIVRHGVEVARSIARQAERGQWYGIDNRKWNLLSGYASEHGYGHLLPLCESAYEKGLLEWRMSVEAGEAALESVKPRALLQLRYEDLIANPGRLCNQLEDLLNLRPDEGMRQFCEMEIRRQNPAAEEGSIPESTAAIAGETLTRLGYTF